MYLFLHEYCSVSFFVGRTQFLSVNGGGSAAAAGRHLGSTIWVHTSRNFLLAKYSYTRTEAVSVLEATKMDRNRQKLQETADLADADETYVQCTVATVY